MVEVTQEELIDAPGTPYTNHAVGRLRTLAHIPYAHLQTLATTALIENWGNSLYVLEKYLAVHTAWSIEQQRYTASDNQLFITAGHLQTRYGTPIYMIFEKNQNPGQQPLYCVHCGSDISAPELPRSPDIPEPPEIPRGVEIVMLHEHILQDNAGRVPFLGQTPPVSQMCAVSGAIPWALNRGLELPYWYFWQNELSRATLHAKSREYHVSPRSNRTYSSKPGFPNCSHCFTASNALCKC